MSEAHDFQEYLTEANKWERQIKPVLKEQILGISVSNISYDNEPEKQLSGIDQVLTREEFNIDVKVRDHDYYGSDLFIETISVLKENKPGWVYNTATDIIAYCWENQPGDNLQDGVLLLLNEHFQNWFDSCINDFDAVTTKPSVDNKGRTWRTKGRIVPIERIPDGFIYKDFDPELPKDKSEYTQSRLD